MEKYQNGVSSRNENSQKVPKILDHINKNNVSSNFLYRNDLMVNDATLRVTLCEFKKHIDNLSAKINESDMKIDELKFEIKNSKKKNSELENENKELNMKIDKLYSSIQLQLENSESKNRLLDIKIQESQADILGINAMIDNIKRSQSLIISNICPENNFEVDEFLKRSLNIQLDKADVESKCILEYGINTNPKVKDFLITFTCYRKKNHVYLKWLETRMPQNNVDNCNRKAPLVLRCKGQGLCIKVIFSINALFIYSSIHFLYNSQHKLTMSTTSGSFV